MEICIIPFFVFEMSNNLLNNEYLIKILNYFAYFSNIFANFYMDSTNSHIVFCYVIAI